MLPPFVISSAEVTEALGQLDAILTEGAQERSA
jgi:hypothetical protein